MVPSQRTRLLLYFRLAWLTPYFSAYFIMYQSAEIKYQ